MLRIFVALIRSIKSKIPIAGHLTLSSLNTRSRILIEMLIAGKRVLLQRLISYPFTINTEESTLAFSRYIPRKRSGHDNLLIGPSSANLSTVIGTTLSNVPSVAGRPATLIKI